MGSDDTAYAEDAVALRDGRFVVGADMVSMRISLVSQAALAFALFGVSEWSAALPALAASLLTLVSVYAIALILYGLRAALMAAALLALLPLDIIHASTLLPTCPWRSLGSRGF